jgi:hypothetical protein
VLTPATNRHRAKGRRITATETHCMRKTAGNIWTDYKTKREIAKELNIIQFYTKYRNVVEIGCNIQTECPVIEYEEY